MHSLPSTPSANIRLSIDRSQGPEPLSRASWAAAASATTSSIARRSENVDCASAWRKVGPASRSATR